MLFSRRLPWQKSVIWPASLCMSCMQPIASSDNIPVLSWFALRGECRNCGARISARYPFVEFLVGLLFLAVYLIDVAHGTTLIGLGVINWFGRGADRQGLIAIFAGNLVVQVLSLVVVIITMQFGPGGGIAAGAIIYAVLASSFPSAACAAASRAIGTRNGEHET